MKIFLTKTNFSGFNSRFKTSRKGLLRNGSFPISWIIS